jgi:nitrate/nitrite transporter NarK
MAITFISQAIIGPVSEPRWKALVLVSIAELLGMSLWFGVSAVAPRLSVEWHLDASTAAWLTLAVQLGFVAGTLASALFNLPDVIRVSISSRSARSAARL